MYCTLLETFNIGIGNTSGKENEPKLFCEEKKENSSNFIYVRLSYMTCGCVMIKVLFSYSSNRLTFHFNAKIIILRFNFFFPLFKSHIFFKYQKHGVFTSQKTVGRLLYTNDRYLRFIKVKSFSFYTRQEKRALRCLQLFWNRLTKIHSTCVLLNSKVKTNSLRQMLEEHFDQCWDKILATNTLW